jgi:hypothetical protein
MRILINCIASFGAKKNVKVTLGTSSIKSLMHMRQKRSFFIHFLKVKFYILPIFINLCLILFKIARKFKMAPYNLHSTISAKNRTFSDFAKSKNATFLTNFYHSPFDSHQLLNTKDSLVCIAHSLRHSGELLLAASFY